MFKAQGLFFCVKADMYGFAAGRQPTSWRRISLAVKDSFIVTSNISDHRTLLLLLAGVGTVDLLDNFWAEAGDLLSPRRVNDLKEKEDR